MVYSSDDIIEEIEYKKQGKEEGTRIYVNGIGIDDVIAFKVEGDKEKYIEKTGEQIFCEERVLGYREEFETYGWTGVVDRCESVVNNSLYYYHKIIYITYCLEVNSVIIEYILKNFV